MAYELEIIAAAVKNGIDPEIPLAVAQRESGRQQYRSDGSVVTGRAGEIGIFQIMPSTAPGVNLRDAVANIDFGVRYLADLFRKFGSWPLALQAYNWGEGNMQRAAAGIKTIPKVVGEYADAILGTHAKLASNSGPAPSSLPQSAGPSPGTVALGALGLAAVLILVMK